MMSDDSSPVPAKAAADALLIARIWAAFIALCHLGGLAGVVVPLFMRPALGQAFAITLLSLSHHVVALVAAVMLLVGLRSSRFSLLLAFALSACYGLVSLFSVSPVFGIVSVGFGLLLYVPPLVLIYWRPQEFR